jgi:uncharacterized damage-inducible protein DinB
VEEPLLEKELIKGLSSIKEIISQIRDDETQWYERFSGNKNSIKPGESFKGSFKEFQKNFLDQSHKLVLFTSSLDDNQLNVDFEYLNTDGEKFSTHLYRVIMHCVNNSTFLRGQIITLLKNLGYDNLSPIDLETYIKESHQ